MERNELVNPGPSSLLFTEEQRAFAETVRRMGERELRDGYLERSTRDEFPWGAYEMLAKHGLLSLALPERWGGQGADRVTIGIAIEEISRFDTALALLLNAGIVLGELVLPNLPQSEAADLAARIASGRALTAFALTESGAGSDTTRLRVRATRTAGGYRLSGEKTSITLASRADHAIVFATVDPALGVGGIAAFWVDLLDPSISRQAFRDPGHRELGRGSLSFDGTFVPEQHMLGEPGRALQQALAEFEYTRAIIGLMCAGTAMRAIELTSDYAKTRTTFGQTISHYQGVSFVLAEHLTYVEAGRQLAYHVLALRDAGLPARREAAMCKWWMPSVAVRAINDCIVLHGHVGYSDEMPLQQMLRDAMAFQIGDGTPQIQKLIIARDLLGRGSM